MEAKRLCELLRAAGMEPRSYSGRGMFGRSCVGVVLDDGNEATEFGLALLVARESLTSCLDDVVSETWTEDDVEKGIRDSHDELDDRRLFRVSRDSMGMDQIVYWTGIPWTPECEEDFVEPDPEACPGCGNVPGDGLTEGCEDADGCGFYREQARGHGVDVPKKD